MQAVEEGKQAGEMLTHIRHHPSCSHFIIGTNQNHTPLTFHSFNSESHTDTMPDSFSNVNWNSPNQSTNRQDHGRGRQQHVFRAGQNNSRGQSTSNRNGGQRKSQFQNNRGNGSQQNVQFASRGRQISNLADWVEHFHGPNWFLTPMGRANVLASIQKSNLNCIIVAEQRPIVITKRSVLSRYGADEELVQPGQSVADLWAETGRRLRFPQLPCLINFGGIRGTSRKSRSLQRFGKIPWNYGLPHLEYIPMEGIKINTIIVPQLANFSPSIPSFPSNGQSAGDASPNGWSETPWGDVPIGVQQQQSPPKSQSPSPVIEIGIGFPRENLTEVEAVAELAGDGDGDKHSIINEEQQPEQQPEPEPEQIITEISNRVGEGEVSIAGRTYKPEPAVLAIILLLLQLGRSAAFSFPSPNSVYKLSEFSHQSILLDNFIEFDQPCSIYCSTLEMPTSRSVSKAKGCSSCGVIGHRFNQWLCPNFIPKAAGGGQKITPKAEKVARNIPVNEPKKAVMEADNGEQIPEGGPKTEEKKVMQLINVLADDKLPRNELDPVLYQIEPFPPHSIAERLELDVEQLSPMSLDYSTLGDYNDAVDGNGMINFGGDLDVAAFEEIFQPDDIDLGMEMHVLGNEFEILENVPEINREQIYDDNRVKTYEQRLENFKNLEVIESPAEEQMRVTKEREEAEEAELKKKWAQIPGLKEVEIAEGELFVQRTITRTLLNKTMKGEDLHAKLKQSQEKELLAVEKLIKAEKNFSRSRSRSAHSRSPTRNARQNERHGSRRSPEIRRRSPEIRRRSPEIRRRSPETRRCSTPQQEDRVRREHNYTNMRGGRGQGHRGQIFNRVVFLPANRHHSPPQRFNTFGRPAQYGLYGRQLQQPTGAVGPNFNPPNYPPPPLLPNHGMFGRHPPILPPQFVGQPQNNGTFGFGNGNGNYGGHGYGSGPSTSGGNGGPPSGVNWTEVMNAAEVIRHAFGPR
jgi:hypothetical protein